jgi:hypothetical protein
VDLGPAIGAVSADQFRECGRRAAPQGRDRRCPAPRSTCWEARTPVFLTGYPSTAHRSPSEKRRRLWQRVRGKE